MSLQEQIEALYEQAPDTLGTEARSAFETFRDGLEKGQIRAEEPFAGGWRVNGAASRCPATLRKFWRQ